MNDLRSYQAQSPIEKIKVLYITGWGRSGSTILDNVLGQIDGFFSVGELRYIWDRSLIQNTLCGCGKPTRECEVWSRVLAQAYGGVDQIDPQEMVRLRDRMRTRHVLLMLFPWGRQWLESRIEMYQANLAKLYRSIQSETNCRVIVDSSKFPSYGYVLSTMQSIDLYVVHLVRDPRGVAYSWLRKKLALDKGQQSYMDLHNPVESSLIWDAWNLTAEALWKRYPDRYLNVHYEDFVRAPQQTITRMLDMLGESMGRLPFAGEREVELKGNHTVSGNPNRFRSGTVELRSDDEWKSQMKTSDRIIATALTWPLLIKYGYLRK
jgi:Sulfotransferase family